MEYRERFKQYKSIANISIEENVLDCFFEKIKEFKKIDEVDDVYEIINMKKMYLKHGQRWFS